MEREQEIDLKQAELCCVIDEKARLRNCLFMETSIFKHIRELSTQPRLGQNGTKGTPESSSYERTGIKLKNILFGYL